MDIRVKFDNSRSNRSQDIGAAPFVMDNEERTTADGPVVIGQNAVPCLPNNNGIGGLLRSLCLSVALCIVQDRPI